MHSQIIILAHSIGSKGCSDHLLFGKQRLQLALVLADAVETDHDLTSFVQRLGIAGSEQVFDDGCHGLHGIVALGDQH